jgi:Holliday junction resolvasome RuvABC endonuclease subunit
MPLVLGIDSSLTGTGLARIQVCDKPADLTDFVDPTEILVATVGDNKPKTKTRREYSRRIAKVVNDVDAAMEGVDLIFMEELAYGAKGATAFVLPWLWGRIIDCAEARDIPIGFANVSQIKKYATGKGNADKDIVLAAVVRRFPEVEITNNNEADALTLALIACRGLGFPVDHPTVAKEEVVTAIMDKGGAAA